MSQFTVHTPESAPEAAIPLLEHAQKQFGGMIPNLYGVMAEAPALLEAYQALNKIFEKSSLSMAERNIVWLTINFANGCTYCMAAHTAVAKYSGLAEDDIEGLRNGTPLTDGKHEALRAFTNHLLVERGWATPNAIDAILAAGYNNATILEVILAIGMKTLSNYTNHIADTPVDPAFEKFVWQQP
jgi:uncharacterized peroxidase-related enzyme